MTDPATVRVVAASAERWPDVAQVMGSSGERGCWCQYWRLSSSAFGALPPGAGRDRLRRLVEAETPPGVLAYVGDEAVGWLGLGPRHEMERLVRSRTIPLIDSVPVWSVLCFLVRVGHRRQGVARALLDGAIEVARAAGAPALEAYPVDPEGARVDVAFGYVGFTPMFERAGFRRVVETAARSDRRARILMRLELR